MQQISLRINKQCDISSENTSLMFRRSFAKRNQNNRNQNDNRKNNNRCVCHLQFECQQEGNAWRSPSYKLIIKCDDSLLMSDVRLLFVLLFLGIRVQHFLRSIHNYVKTNKREKIENNWTFGKLRQ